MHSFERAYQELATHVDRMFMWLLGIEWLGMIGAALCLSPSRWNSHQSSLHPHVWAAILSGPAFILPAIAVAVLFPGRPLTRHLIATAQMFVSVVLIDITGGRLETHFHIFGSLAFLIFYRDWRVLVTASLIAAIDHIVRGIWLPQSLYGVPVVSSWRWVEHVWWIFFEDCFLVIAARRSVKEMRAVAVSKAQLHAGAYRDVLTGLANRRLLQESFESAPLSGSRAARAVLFLDLDRFKQANDTLGHSLGDKLLTQVAQRLAAVVSADDTLARVGGDEFVVLLDEIAQPSEAVEMGARLLGALALPFEVEGHELLLSASVGISLHPEHGTDLLTLQAKADKAMYAAKSQGRNQCVLFSAEIASHENVLKEIGRDLYRALSAGDLRLHFQPLVEPGAKLVGFEALIRWTHPVHGTIAPADFIPLAERSGMIVAIGEWVIREACRNCLTWQHHGSTPLGVAVNVSAVQLEQPEFAGRVIAILKELSIEPSRLTLELTESVLLKEAAASSQQLTMLRNAGVRIALDDFGTGYSSLSYLVTLPADTIKLDRSFLNREFSQGAVLVESVIEMAHRVGLRVVAEGVETRAQSDRLLGLNCDELQGFYFSAPMPADVVAGYIESSRPAKPQVLGAVYR